MICEACKTLTCLGEGGEGVGQFVLGLGQDRHGHMSAHFLQVPGEQASSAHRPQQGAQPSPVLVFGAQLSRERERERDRQRTIKTNPLTPPLCSLPNGGPP